MRDKSRYVVEVDGKPFEVGSIAAAESLLLQVRGLAEESADRDVKTSPPRVSVKTISGNRTTSRVLQQAVTRTQRTVTEAYVKRSREIAQDIEISQLMIAKIKAEERNDESAIIALLLM